MQKITHIIIKKHKSNLIEKVQKYYFYIGIIILFEQIKLNFEMATYFERVIKRIAMK